MPVVQKVLKPCTGPVPSLFPVQNRINLEHFQFYFSLVPYLLLHNLWNMWHYKFKPFSCERINNAETAILCLQRNVEGIKQEIEKRDGRVVHAENVFQDNAILNKFNINVNIGDVLLNRIELAPLIEGLKRTFSTVFSAIMGAPTQIDIRTDLSNGISIFIRMR